MLYLVLTIEVILTFSIIILSSLTIVYVVMSIIEKLQDCYEERKLKKHIQRQEKEREEYRQRCYKRELEQRLRKEERRKYPLFFWRELCSQQRKENI